MSYSYSRIRPSNGLLSSSKYDSNGNIRVELSPTPRQRTSLVSREPLKITSSTINRSHTFSKAEKPSHMIRSDTFIMKNHHSDEYSDEQNAIDYGTYSRSRSKSKSRNYSSDEKSRHYNDDKSNYATYTKQPAAERKVNGGGHEKSLYVNVDNYRKSSRNLHRDDHHRRRSHSQDSSDRNHVNSSTLTRRSKPKRVESFMKKFDINFWKRRDSKDKSPSPATNNGGDTLKRTKNIFNIIASSKKSTRDIGIECKLDEEERDFFDSSYNGGNGMGMRKSSIQSLTEEIPKYRRASKPKVYEHGSTQLLTSIIKTPERRYNYKSVTSTIPATTNRVGFKYSPPKEIEDVRRKPVGVASPQPQVRSRSVLKNTAGNNTLKKTSTLKLTRLLTTTSNENNNNNNEDDLTRQGSGDRMSFREYRERLLKMKNENRRMADNSDDDLRKSHQQSFFVPI